VSGPQRGGLAEGPRGCALHPNRGDAFFLSRSSFILDAIAALAVGVPTTALPRRERECPTMNIHARSRRGCGGALVGAVAPICQQLKWDQSPRTRAKSSPWGIGA
jgi:hypothetical protein